jgi:hypothetical protein
LFFLFSFKSCPITTIKAIKILISILKYFGFLLNVEDCKNFFITIISFRNEMKVPENLREVPRTFGNSSFSLCLEPFKLYESIVVLKWPDSDNNDNKPKFNAAAMGIRFIDEYSLALNPYPDTDTSSILKKCISDKIRKKITINFTDDMVLFAKAALTGLNAGSSEEELLEGELIKYEEFAFVKNANASILGELVSDFGDFNLDASQYFKDLEISNFKIEYPAKFEINILKRFRAEKMFQVTNRGDNLAIEAITLASKLPPYFTENEGYDKKNEKKIYEILNRIREYEREIRRFSAGKKALLVCEIIDNFLSGLF